MTPVSSPRPRAGPDPSDRSTRTASGQTPGGSSTTAPARPPTGSPGSSSCSAPRSSASSPPRPPRTSSTRTAAFSSAAAAARSPCRPLDDLVAGLPAGRRPPASTQSTASKAGSPRHGRGSIATSSRPSPPRRTFPGCRSPCSSLTGPSPDSALARLRAPSTRPGVTRPATSGWLSSRLRVSSNTNSARSRSSGSPGTAPSQEGCRHRSDSTGSTSSSGHRSGSSASRVPGSNRSSSRAPRSRSASCRVYHVAAGHPRV